jgi:hypothetical protein
VCAHIPLAEALLGVLDHLALSVRRAVPDSGRVRRAYFVHVDELLLARAVTDVAKLKLGVHKDLVMITGLKIRCLD